MPPGLCEFTPIHAVRRTYFGLDRDRDRIKTEAEAEAKTERQRQILIWKQIQRARGGGV